MDDQMRTIVDRARAAFKAGKVKTYEQRCQFLLRIDKFLKDQTDAIIAAQRADLRKTYNEVMISEISTSRAELTMHLQKLKSWMKPQTVSKPMLNLSDKTYIQAQPYGVVLLIVPWNYPFYLLFTPLIGAIAAGNCVVIKPSEVSVASEKLIRDHLNKYIPADCFPVVCGGPAETSSLLKQRFDYIFFTGATNIGRIVMKAAAEHITPVTLELGGKSPTFVDASSDMQLVANRVIANKAFNAGQACISYDYIMCTKETQERLIEPMKKAIERFFGEDMQESESFSRIINDRHFDRLDSIKRSSKGRLVIDNGADKSDLYMGLAVIADVDASDSCMQEEIFGPILPLVPVKNLQEAIDMINEREKPLAAYVFSKDSSVIREFEENTTSGAIVVNDSSMNMAISTLPFGGVGQSGIGAYHGKFTFDTFSHKRAVMHRKQAMEGLNVMMRYPPHTTSKTHRLMSLLFTTQDSTGTGIYVGITVVVLGMMMAVGAVLYKHQQTVNSF